MKIKSLLLFLTLTFISLANLHAQIAIPKDYFSSPLNINLSLTGSFSEIRPNHLHSGADISTQGRVGLPIFAVADGVVSRIRVSPTGFGNALYIDHPNGFTSVYGHMLGYNDTITSYLRSNQYKFKSFAVDLFPSTRKDIIYVKRGQIIGYTGNSGSSGGPHLHFELRNTRTENTINPLLFGFNFPDKYPPYIDFIKFYPEDNNSFIGPSNDVTRFNVKKSGKDEYRLSKDTLSLWGKFSLGVQAFDFNQSQSNRNGFYNMKMYLDGNNFFSIVCDSLSFAETRYVNASIDYADNYNKGSRIVKSGKLPGNKLSFFKTATNNGILSFMDDKAHEIVITVADLAGNTVNLRFWVVSHKPEGFVQIPSPRDADTSVKFRYNKFNKFQNDDLKVEIPAGSLYQDITFGYRKSPGNKIMYSDIHYIHDPEVPLQNKIKVSVKASKLPQNLRSKTLLVRVNRHGRRSSAGGSYENGYVSTSTNLFDGYAIVVDTVPPVIRPSAENSKSKTVLKFTVSDNFSGIDTYRGEVNGQWVLVEWDPKTRLMIYRFDKIVQPGKNTFTLFLADEKGNKSSYSTTFTK